MHLILRVWFYNFSQGNKGTDKDRLKPRFIIIWSLSRSGSNSLNPVPDGVNVDISNLEYLLSNRKLTVCNMKGLWHQVSINQFLCASI